MDLGLAGRVALVTAASKGLGRASAQALVDEGASVAINSRDPERLRATAAKMGEEVLALPGDVTDPDAPRRLVEATVERFGGLHVLVANAGGPPKGRAVDVDDSTLQAAIDANLLTYLFGQPLTVNDQEIAIIVGLGAAIVAAMLVLRRGLFAVVTDEDWSRVAGLPVGLLNTVLAVIVAASVVAAMRIVGLLLVAAMMVLPVASGQLLARSFRGTLWWSVAIGVASVVAGLAASRIWGLAPGGTIVLISGAIFVAVALIKRARVPKLQAEGAGL